MFQGRSLHTYICTKGTDTDAHKNKEYKIAVRKTPSMACCGQYNIMGCRKHYVGVTLPTATAAKLVHLNVI